MTGRKAALHNLGCKVNAYETEAMQQLLEEAGYEIVPFAPGADVYIINTCTVTNMADRKSRQMLHRAKKMNPDAIVVAAGCYAQASPEEAKADLSIDLVIGNNKKKDLVALLEEFREKRECLSEKSLCDMTHMHEYEPLGISRTAEHTRAYIKVQDGCNQFCSYCIIPYTRGRVRSRSEEDIYREIVQLSKGGYQEVVLTGIHLSSYGVDTGSSLLALIRRIHGIEGIKRIRLGSLEPGIITEAFAGALSSMEKICPHFHLSLQSGCDATLARMNRRYTAGEYQEKCRILRKHFADPALTTDVIVGFPGETEEEFDQTVRFLTEIAFYETHIFKYSRRKGTKADRMEGQVPEQIKTARSEKLLALDEINRRAYEERFMGKPVEILLEEEIFAEGRPWLVGHTREYIKAALPKEMGRQGEIVSAILDGSLKNKIVTAHCVTRA